MRINSAFSIADGNVEVVAVNDPFIETHYAVCSHLPFCYSHGSIESPQALQNLGSPVSREDDGVCDAY